MTIDVLVVFVFFFALLAAFVASLVIDFRALLNRAPAADGLRPANAPALPRPD